MKSRTRYLVRLTAARTIAVKKLVVVVVASLAVFALGATASQAAVTTNVRIPVDFQDVNWCAGEVVQFSGDIHILVTATINDNNVSGKFLLNAQGMSAIGLSSGITYQSHDSINDTFKASLQNGNAVTSQQETFSLVAPGGGNNLEFKVVLHMTFDADGNLVATKFDPSGICL